MLVKSGANIEIKDYTEALSKKHTNIYKFLFSSIVDEKSRQEMLDKIMYDNTSKTGDTEILTSLIDMGCDVNKEYKDSQKKRSYTPIQLVLEKSAYIDHGVVELLINRGAIVTQNDIEIARERNDDDIVIGEKTIELLEKTLGLQSYYQGDNIHKEVDDFIKNVYQEAKKNNDHTYLIEKYRELDLNQRDYIYKELSSKLDGEKSFKSRITDNKLDDITLNESEKNKIEVIVNELEEIRNKKEQLLIDSLQAENPFTQNKNNDNSNKKDKSRIKSGDLQSSKSTATTESQESSVEELRTVNLTKPENKDKKIPIITKKVFSNLNEIFNYANILEKILNIKITSDHLIKHKVTKEEAKEIEGKTVKEVIKDSYNNYIINPGMLTAVGVGKFSLALVGACVLVGGAAIYGVGKIAKFGTLGLANLTDLTSMKVSRKEAQNNQNPLGITREYARNKLTGKAGSHGRVNFLEKIGYHAVLNGYKALNNVKNEKWYSPTPTAKSNKDNSLKL